MKLTPILATIGLAAATGIPAQAADLHAHAAALLGSGSRIEATVPLATLPSVASSDVRDSQTRAANLLNRPVPSETTSSAPSAESRRTTAPDAHELARHLLERRT